MEEINANIIDIMYINEYNNVNISVRNTNRKNYQIICNTCLQNENFNIFEDCNNNCSTDSNNNNLQLIDQSSSIIVKNNRKRKKFKFQVYEIMNEKVLSNSSIHISFNNLNSHNNNSKFITIIFFLLSKSFLIFSYNTTVKKLIM
jgi:hypothetical protein